MFLFHSLQNFPTIPNIPLSVFSNEIENHKSTYCEIAIAEQEGDASHQWAG